MSRIAGRFARIEPRRTARDVVLGLLSPVERKNCWWFGRTRRRTASGPPQAARELGLDVPDLALPRHTAAASPHARNQGA